MPTNLTRAKGQPTVAGATLYTVPAGNTAIILGLRAVNIDPGTPHWVGITLGGTYIGPKQTELVDGGGYEFIETSKLVLLAGESIVAYSDADTVIDAYITIAERS